MLKKYFKKDKKNKKKIINKAVNYSHNYREPKQEPKLEPEPVKIFQYIKRWWTMGDIIIVYDGIEKKKIKNINIFYKINNKWVKQRQLFRSNYTEMWKIQNGKYQIDFSGYDIKIECEYNNEIYNAYWFKDEFVGENGLEPLYAEPKNQTIYLNVILISLIIIIYFFYKYQKKIIGITKLLKIDNLINMMKKYKKD